MLPYRIALVTLALFVSACGTSPEVPDYSKAASREDLKVPPDLTNPAMDNYPIPDISSYSGYQRQTREKPIPLLPAADNVRFMRDGSLHWLELDISAEKVWSKARQFVQELGFSIATEERLLGYFDTNWQKDRIQSGGWFSSIGRVFADDTMDSFRFRIERLDSNTTRLFIMHRGLVETTQELNGNEQAGWQSRPVDAELETEMLNRFLVFAGLNEELALAKVQKQQQQKTRFVSLKDKQFALELEENFSRTWRRVGIALDRSGFIVEDRNRSGGLYYIQLPENFGTRADKSWLEKISKAKDGSGAELLLHVIEKDKISLVILKSRNSTAIPEHAAHTILEQLQQQMY